MTKQEKKGILRLPYYKERHAVIEALTEAGYAVEIERRDEDKWPSEDFVTYVKYEYKGKADK